MPDAKTEVKPEVNVTAMFLAITATLCSFAAKRRKELANIGKATMKAAKVAGIDMEAKDWRAKVMDSLQAQMPERERVVYTNGVANTIKFQLALDKALVARCIALHKQKGRAEAADCYTAWEAAETDAQAYHILKEAELRKTKPTENYEKPVHVRKTAIQRVITTVQGFDVATIDTLIAMCNELKAMKSGTPGITKAAKGAMLPAAKDGVITDAVTTPVQEKAVA